MNTVAEVRDAIYRAYDKGVQDVGEGILRVERRYGDRTYAVAYVDLSDDVVERAKSLGSFQENLLGGDFFSSDSDLRWNSYLYFWAGPRSTQSSGFGNAKSAIEADRHFARKFVLDDDELLLRLHSKERTEPTQQPVLADVGEVWASQLRGASLGVLLEQRPRTATLDDLSDGSAFRAEPSSAPPVPIKRDALATGMLRKLEIGTFRRVHSGRSFDFSDVNLIIGANGTGKTSLLEAIEALYCGRVRRDQDATFHNLSGTLLMPDSRTEVVRATTNVATLKARNVAWYGRTDTQSSAISQGFTRFNFLDTDAAFRLSSEQSREQIKLDLSRLLVGPETSKLWTYLTKLTDELAAKLRGIHDRLPSERRQVELLATEINRLKEAPSNASVALQTFRSRISELKPAWPVAEDDTVLGASTRARLETLQKWLASAVGSSGTASSSRAELEHRRRQLKTLTERVHLLTTDEDVHVATVEASSEELDEAKAALQTLESWAALVAANVPTKARELRALHESIAGLRNALGVSTAPIPGEVSSEYRALSLGQALALARGRTSQAIESERAASSALAQQQRLGETLAALRADLHHVSATYIKQSGDDTHCPVCGTGHQPGELLSKLEKMLGVEDVTGTASLRQSLQYAREQAATARSDEELLSTLAVLAKSLRLEAAASVSEVHHGIVEARQLLETQTAAYDGVRNHLAQVSSAGINWTEWSTTRDAVASLLEEAQIEDPASQDSQLTAMRTRIDALQTGRLEALRKLEGIRSEVALLVKGLTVSTGTVRDALTGLQRLESDAAAAVVAVEEAASQIAILPDEPLDSALKRVEAAMLAFDRAAHARNQDEQARADLAIKEKELSSATQRLNRDEVMRTNLERASGVLTNLVEQHSLEQATADSFRSIKDKVSAIFAQIHSPPEYELGGFDDERGLLVRREDGRHHAVDQVSTGQRAALALSIFLASNDSAKSAPPVLLIDDPVAHIDDLNALSFLDYLRELVLREGKQVFFATADIRLAALFQRKFEFLGNQRFKRISLA